MNFFQAIFLGLVQALTEYLPVSSSAHIRIIGDLMLGSDPGAAFTAIIQIGTELAVILYFRHDIIRILGAWFGSLFGKEGKDFKSRMGAHNPDTQMGWFIILGTMPILIAGLLFKHAIEGSLRNLDHRHRTCIVRRAAVGGRRPFQAGQDHEGNDLEGCADLRHRPDARIDSRRFPFWGHHHLWTRHGIHP